VSGVPTKVKRVELSFLVEGTGHCVYAKRDVDGFLFRGFLLVPKKFTEKVIKKKHFQGTTFDNKTRLGFKTRVTY
jgi:hypothetical protein